GAKITEGQSKGRSDCCGLDCPSWDRTRTLLIQSQACCQLHQGAPKPERSPSVRLGERRDDRMRHTLHVARPATGLAAALVRRVTCNLQRVMDLKGLEPLTSWVRSRRSPS